MQLNWFHCHQSDPSLADATLAWATGTQGTRGCGESEEWRASHTQGLGRRLAVPGLSGDVSAHASGVFPHSSYCDNSQDFFPEILLQGHGPNLCQKGL